MFRFKLPLQLVVTLFCAALMVSLFTGRAAAEIGDRILVAGGANFAGDDWLAIDARLYRPAGVFVDGSGNIYFADSGNSRIRKVDAETGIISTVAGNGERGDSGDEGAATDANLNGPQSVALDASGNLYIGDTSRRVRKVDAEMGIITTVAGTGASGFSGDGGLATEARLGWGGVKVCVDGEGNIIISGNYNARIRKVDAQTGIISTVAGGDIGDGGPATDAKLGTGYDVFVDGSGDIYIVDPDNYAVRKVDVETGIITTVSGNGVSTPYEDGVPATETSWENARRVVVDGSGNIYTQGNFVHRIDAETGIITTVAGGGEDPGDGIPATEATHVGGRGLGIDSAGNIYLAATWNHRIRKVDMETGIITTLAGTGEAGFSGDEGPAAEAQVNRPEDICVDGDGNVYFADVANHRVRMIDAETGIISTVAGNGVKGDSEDGGSATEASLDNPRAVALDSEGNLYIGDGNRRVRKVDMASGIIVGAVPMRSRYGIFVDDAGNLYTLNGVVWMFEGIAAPPPPPPPPPPVSMTGKHRVVVVATVTQDGAAAAGLEVSLSRSISGQPSDYKWTGTTGPDGMVEIEILADDPMFWRTGASGYYRARAVDPASGDEIGKWGSIPINGGMEVAISLPVGGAATVEDESPLAKPVSFGLAANSPNPFNPSTQIAYQLSEAGDASLVIYNTLGQEVRRLVQGYRAAGAYRVTWDGTDALGRQVSTGIYLYRLMCNGMVETRRMLLLK